MAPWHWQWQLVVMAMVNISSDMKVLLFRYTVTDRIIETKKKGKCPGFPRAIRKREKQIKKGFWCPGIFPCPGKILSIIKGSMILSVTAKQEFSPFFAGIANYRKPAAVKT